MTFEKGQPVRPKSIDLYGPKHNKGKVDKIEEGVVWVEFPLCCLCPCPCGKSDTHTLGFYVYELEEA